MALTNISLLRLIQQKIYNIGGDKIEHGWPDLACGPVVRHPCSTFMIFIKFIFSITEKQTIEIKCLSTQRKKLSLECYNQFRQA